MSFPLLEPSCCFISSFNNDLRFTPSENSHRSAPMEATLSGSSVHIAALLSNLFHDG